jgi:hypothetical protein
VTVPRCAICLSPAACVHDVGHLARLPLCLACAAGSPHAAIIEPADFPMLLFADPCWCSQRSAGRRVPWCPMHGEHAESYPTKGQS